MIMASETGGVKSFSLQGRLYRERERCMGMTDKERHWRAKWLEDQILTNHEPLEVPRLRIELTNPIRRAYQAPMSLFGMMLKPLIGADAAKLIRALSGKAFMGIGFVYAAAYYFKYNANDWSRKGGWRVVPNRLAVYPGDPGYPDCVGKNPAEYASRGFDKAPI